jgi:hypothetical protein
VIILSGGGERMHEGGYRLIPGVGSTQKADDRSWRGLEEPKEGECHGCLDTHKEGARQYKDWKMNKRNVLRGFCLRVGLFTSIRGMGGGWGSWSPDWDRSEGSPDQFHGHTSGCVWCGNRLVVVSHTMTGGL